jgi:putative membrane protein
MALSPAIYMQLASTSSLFAIRASELAASRSTSSRTRSAAEAIVRDQGGVAAQLSFAGRRLELLPSAALTDAQAAELERMRLSSDFDSDYRRSVAGALARALEAHQAFARSGSSPTLRPVAEMAAPVTRRNLEALRR